ncbi:MAG: universal stress protein [Candidatus Nitrosocosmicus sp.]|nr:universal stress protein [Candidatus Nitrosocosmicus sp.]MDN5866581.1 universal stress protein [Candidatus Nitrosocosmicus sp.]
MIQVQISKILVCIDGSELSKKAGTLVINVAKKCKSRSYALSAYNVPDLHDLYSERKKFIHVELDDKITKAKELLEIITKEARGAGVNMQPEFINTKLASENAIIEFAEKESIAMMILGSTGTSSLKNTNRQCGVCSCNKSQMHCNGS